MEPIENHDSQRTTELIERSESTVQESRKVRQEAHWMIDRMREMVDSLKRTEIDLALILQKRKSP